MRVKPDASRHYASQPMTRVNIFLPPEMIARLKVQKDRTGVPAAEFVRRAIEAALQRVNL